MTVLATAAALLTIAIPALSMRVGLPDGSSEPVELGVVPGVHDDRGRSSAPAPPGRCSSRRSLPVRPRRRPGAAGAGRRRPEARRPGRRGGRRARSPSQTTTARRVPGGAGRGPEQRLDRGARARPARPRRPSTATSPSASPVRPRSTSTSRRTSPAVLPLYLGGRGRPLAAHHDPGVPLDPRAAHRDGRLHPVALRDLRRDRRGVPVGLAGRMRSASQHGSDPELPAGHPRRHPVRARDGLPAVPGVRHARGLRARRARASRGRAGLPRRARRSSSPRGSSWSRSSAGSSSRSPP